MDHHHHQGKGLKLPKEVKKPLPEYFLSATKGEVRTRIEMIGVAKLGPTRFFGVGFTGRRWLSTQEKEHKDVTLVLVEPNVSIKGIHRFSLD